jgi:hypothetical protein
MMNFWFGLGLALYLMLVLMAGQGRRAVYRCSRSRLFKKNLWPADEESVEREIRFFLRKKSWWLGGCLFFTDLFDQRLAGIGEFYGLVCPGRYTPYRRWLLVTIARGWLAVPLLWLGMLWAVVFFLIASLANLIFFSFER